MIVDTFGEMLERAAEQPLVLGLALHPFIVGQPHRIRPLRRALRHVAAQDARIWVATAGGLADHVIALGAAEWPAAGSNTRTGDRCRLA